jgi:hypothetical protein
VAPALPRVPWEVCDAREAKSLRVWDASECVLMFIDYQDRVLDVIFAQDRRVIELNVRTLAKMAVAFKIQ